MPTETQTRDPQQCPYTLLYTNAHARRYTLSDASITTLDNAVRTLLLLLSTTSSSLLSLMASVLPTLPHYETCVRAACRYIIECQVFGVRVGRSNVVQRLCTTVSTHVAKQSDVWWATVKAFGDPIWTMYEDEVRQYVRAHTVVDAWADTTAKTE